MPKSVPTASKKPVKKTAKKVAGKVGKKKSLSKKIVQKKPYFELVTAILSIPVLITLSILNINSLTKINATPTPTPEANTVQKRGFFAAPVEPKITNSPSVAVDAPCKEGIGPVSIATPGENDKVVDNPVIITIAYDDREYCGVAWSYSINGGNWSSYDDRSVALYNLPQGQVTFELRVKSITTSDEKTLTRKFTYEGKGTVLVPDPNSSGSAN